MGNERVTLKRLYRDYNKWYFQNRLPDIPVQWKKMSRFTLAGETYFLNGEPIKITLSKQLRRLNVTIRRTLLHEMVHVEQKEIPHRFKHGPRFRRRMRELTQAGAFDYLW